MDAGCASSIEAIESGEAHAPELAHVAKHEFTLGAWTLSSRHRCQGHSTGSKSAEPSALSDHNVGKRDSAVRATLGLFEKADCAGDRISRGWLAGVGTGEHREGSQNLPPNQGAMAVLADPSKASAAFVTRST